VLLVPWLHFGLWQVGLAHVHLQLLLQLRVIGSKRSVARFDSVRSARAVVAHERLVAPSRRDVVLVHTLALVLLLDGHELLAHRKA